MRDGSQGWVTNGKRDAGQVNNTLQEAFTEMFSSVASEAPTLSPGLSRSTSFKISMVPLEILVGIFKAWKKEVFSGPIPVFCAGTVTGSGAIAPALAGARTLLSLIT